MIIRERYLSKIRPFYDQDLIKVIMGIRRCGKSVLLLQIIDELKEKEIEEKQIIYINFENEDYSFIKNDIDLHNFIKEKIYIQVAYILADDSDIDREFGAYKSIEDNYPKYVLTMDKHDFSQNGIIHKNVIDWLLQEEK